MKKRILFVFLLMSFSVIGITILQLYYSSVNYDIAKNELQKDIDECFAEAVDSTFSLHRQHVVNEFGNWMRDNKMIKATSRWDEEKQRMVFKLKEIFKSGPEKEREISFTVETLENKKLDEKEAKEFMIKTMKKEVMYSLKNGIVLFYTQEMGRMTDDLFRKTPIKIKVLESEYKASLKRKNIDLPFHISEGKAGTGQLCTPQYGIATGYVPLNRKANACFNDIDSYLLGQLKWIILGTFVLIVISLFCFGYTIRVLLSQQKLSEMKDNFISNMTHEIHSPISSVMITAEAMKEFDMTREERDSYADIILHQSKKLSALADEILEGARLDKKGIDLKDTIEVDKLLKEVVAIYKDKAEIIYTGNEVILKGNKGHFERAVINLVDNAIKYNNNETIKVEITTKKGNNEIQLSIADNGPGIPDSYKSKVFDQFYRIPTGNVHNVKGYGLGLSYVKKVIKAHKGSIEIKDSNPTGSIFIIRISYEA